MRIDQAVFGERDRGHGVRAATCDARLAEELVQRLDLPDAAPPGVAWSPFPSGFPHSDRYVLARTFHDPNASRSGMVLSHALILPAAEAACCDDLRPILSHLSDVPEVPERLSILELDASRGSAGPVPELLGVAEALVAGGAGPVVRLRVEGFEDLVAALWRELWPAVRRTLSFRLSFGPDDVREPPRPTLVCTPQALATRWRGSRVVDATPREPSSLSAALLAGRHPVPSPLAFAGMIGADLATFADLRLVEEAQSLGTGGVPSFVESAAAVRLVQRLSPDRDRGTEAKARLLAQLSSTVEAADAAEILTLRNLELGGFRGDADLWRGVERLVARRRFDPARDDGSLQVIRAAARETGAVPPWREAVTSGLRSAARRSDGGFPSAFWRWAGVDRDLPRSLADVVDLDSAVERSLVEAAPQLIDEGPARTLMAIARDRRLSDLHGVAASVIRPLTEAARAQIAMEGETPGERGLTLALRDATPDELLSCALEIDDPRLVRLTALAVARTPGALGAADMRKPRVRTIWAAALSMDAGAWAAPGDPEAAVHALIDDLIDGRPADAGLVAALGATPLADLGSHARRADAWRRLSGRTLDAFLDATGEGWVRRATADAAPYAPDPTLEARILRRDPFRVTGAAGAPLHLAAGLRIASALPSLTELGFSQWLDRILGQTRSVAPRDAEALGRLVLDRGWRRVVDGLKQRLRGGRVDLRPGLRAASTMLGWLDLWLLDVTTPSLDEKWTALEALAAELYPSGPAHEGLWERAGGSDADLPTRGTGRDAWHEVLARMRRGGGHVRVSRLLQRMREDFGTNEHVAFVMRDPDFGGGRWQR